MILEYADDVDRVSQSNRNVRKTFTRFEAALTMVLKINQDKIKYIMVSKNTRHPIRQTVINDYNFEVVNKFKYLGSFSTNNNL